MEQHYKFTLMDLPYAYDALEPYLTEEVVKIHHTRHHQAYVNNLNEALTPYPQYQGWTLEQLVTRYQELPLSISAKVRNNAGGVNNHNLYFLGMAPPKERIEAPQLLLAIEEGYGTFEDFTAVFLKEAADVFGSGYCWLVGDPRAKAGLRIVTTPNQDTVLPMGLFPLFTVDVWEHAYYLQYLNKRPEYLKNWFYLINWERANIIFVNYQRQRYSRGL